MIPILIIIIKKHRERKESNLILNDASVFLVPIEHIGKGVCIDDIHSKLTYDDGLANILEIVKTNCYVGTIGH